MTAPPSLNHHGVSRLRWVPRTLDLLLIEGPPDRYRRAAMAWPAGTKDCVDLLDRLGIPTDYGRGRARQLLQQHNEKASNDLLGAALRYRKERENLAGRQVPGQVPAGQARTDARTDASENPSEQGTDRATDRCGQATRPTADSPVPLGTDSPPGPPLGHPDDHLSTVDTHRGHALFEATVDNRGHTVDTKEESPAQAVTRTSTLSLWTRPGGLNPRAVRHPSGSTAPAASRRWSRPSSMPTPLCATRSRS